MPVHSRTSLTAALDLLDERGAGRLPHGDGRTLHDHLRGTMQVLSHWGQPDEVIAAGLLHSIYSTDIYHQALVPLSDRKKVAAAAGDVAERWAHLFCVIRRASFFEELARAKDPGWDQLRVECHQGPPTIQLSRNDVGALLIIYMANTAEQTRAADFSPGIWLSMVSRWGASARRLWKRLPPVFEQCSAHVDLAAERSAVESYEAALSRMTAKPAAGAAAALDTVKHLPWVAEPLVLLGYCALLDQRWSDAFHYANAARQRLVAWGTSWDKRLTHGEWTATVTAIAQCAETAFTDPRSAERQIEARKRASAANGVEVLRALGGKSHGASVGPISPSLIPPRFISYLDGFRRTDAPAKHNMYPSLSKRPVYEAERIPLALILRDHYREIKDEFSQVRPNGVFHEEVERIGRTGSWNVFMLYELGKRNDANCELCPRTAALIEKHGGVQGISSAAYFSILAPHSHVAAHKGPTNMRLRCHLGLEVPDGCRLRVDRDVLTWREGQCLVFDDSFVHEVWNDSDRPRAVLVVDVWHPDLSAEEVTLLGGLQRYAYAHAKDMNGYWVKNEKARQPGT